jgi:hypothetical protein
MNLAALIINIYVPLSLKRKKLTSLFKATAEAFDVAMPDISHLTVDATLESYALFTKHEVEKRLASGDNLNPVKDALYRHAYSLGKELREQLHVRSASDVLRTGRALYKAIGIDFKGSMNGMVEIRSCFFSRYYTEAVCRIMSSLDEGVAAGLSDGGELRISQRITEGKSACLASFGQEGTRR